MLAREADAVAVQAFLGHSKLSTTERYMHAKARPDDLARLDRAFASPGIAAETADSRASVTSSDDAD